MSKAIYYICKDCGSGFDESEFKEEWIVERDDDPPYAIPIPVRLCPYCHSEDFVEADFCDECGEAFLPSELVGGHYCADCLQDISTPYHEHLFAEAEKDAYAEFLHECRENAPHDQLDYLTRESNGESKG